MESCEMESFKFFSVQSLKSKSHKVDMIIWTKVETSEISKSNLHWLFSGMELQYRPMLKLGKQARTLGAEYEQRIL